MIEIVGTIFLVALLITATLVLVGAVVLVGYAAVKAIRELNKAEK